MAQFTDEGKMVDRRAFLRGSALFAASAVGLAIAAPAFAQDPQKPAEDATKKDGEKPKDGAPSKDQPKAGGDQAAAKPAQDPNKLYDKDGVEYRVCERCGGNMYKEGNTWTCEQCGLSYVE